MSATKLLVTNMPRDLLQIRNLVIGSPNWVGDVVMAEPMLRRLAGDSRYRILLCCRSHVLDLCRLIQVHLSSLDVMTYDAFDRQLGAHTENLRPDQTVWLNLALDADLLVRAKTCGARHVWGYPRPDTAHLISLALDNRFVRRDVHHVDNYLALLPLLGHSASGAGRPRLTRPRSPHRREGPRMVLLNTSSCNDPAKRYPGGSFVELANRMLAACEDIEIILTGLVADRSRNAVIRDTLCSPSRCRDTSGQLTLRTLIDLIAHAALVVSSDTGPLHIAAALGTPCVGLFGPTSPRWTVPLGERAHYLQSRVTCAPCFATHCPLPTQLCFNDLKPSRAMQLIEQERLLCGKGH